jgi:hypothetical protein
VGEILSRFELDVGRAQVLACGLGAQKILWTRLWSAWETAAHFLI